MCKMSFKNNINVVAKRSLKNRNRLDFYLIVPGRGYEYAFTRKYKKSCYNLCKSPVMLNKILYERRHDVALMNLKKYFNYMMDYLVEYLGLEDFVLKETKNRYRMAAWMIERLWWNLSAEPGLFEKKFSGKCRKKTIMTDILTRRNLIVNSKLF